LEINFLYFGQGIRTLSQPNGIASRFRGFLPVVIDFETGGFNAATDAILEVAATIIELDDKGKVQQGECFHYHVNPFPGSNIEAAALEVTGIDPHHPFRFAIDEKEAVGNVFREIREAMKKTGCTRAVLVGHNAWFDLSFLNAAVDRCHIKRNPFHPFTCFDTATLAGVAFGQTVLSRAVIASGQDWSSEEAHSARYDTERTADLFCRIINDFEPTYLANRNAKNGKQLD